MGTPEEHAAEERRKIEREEDRKLIRKEILEELTKRDEHDPEEDEHEAEDA